MKFRTQWFLPEKNIPRNVKILRAGMQIPDWEQLHKEGMNEAKIKAMLACGVIEDEEANKDGN